MDISLGHRGFNINNIDSYESLNFLTTSQFSGFIKKKLYIIFVKKLQ